MTVSNLRSGRATIDNQSGFPLIPVRRVVRWALREFDVDLPSVMVRVERWNNQRAIGKFYANAKTRRPRVWASASPGLKISREAKHLILSRVSEMQFPSRKMRGGPPFFLPQNWVESLLVVTAHEAMHLRQFLFPKPGKPRYSEVEAEWASYRLLERFREKGKAWH